GDPSMPIDLEILVKSGYGVALAPDHVYNWQPTMLTPVGGADRIATALAAKVARRIKYNTEVREIRRTAAGGARITYVERSSGGAETWREAQADFCICTIPAKVLVGIPADFSPDVATGLLAVEGDPAF